METSLLNERLAEIVLHHPSRARVLEDFQLDYCCRGNRTLEEACREQTLDPARVISELSGGGKDEDAGLEWQELSLSGLVAHIEETHHHYIREAFPRLANLFERVVAIHRLNHPELVDSQEVFLELWAELQPHLLKEERVLFPFIRMLATTPAEGVNGAFIENPIRVMEFEHESAGALLREIRGLLAGFQSPADACGSYRALLEGLAEFEADLHLHIYKENYVLFPMALELAARCGN